MKEKIQVRRSRLWASYAAMLLCIPLLALYGASNSHHDDCYSDFSQQYANYLKYANVAGAYEYYFLGRALPSYCYFETGDLSDYYCSPSSMGGGGVAGAIQNNSGVSMYNYWASLGDHYYRTYHH